MADTALNLLEQAEDTMKGRFLTFDLGEEVFGIGIHHVTEIIGLQTINKLPEMPDYIQGIINLRGKIVPVIDMGMKFRRPKKDYSDRTCIIVIETQHLTAGLIVDHVAEVMAIDDSNIAPPPELESGINCRYLNGVGKVNGEVVILLDCEQLFNDEETQIIRESKIKM
jgi:purine-binding chemotaxis protein CheW